ncbi:phosphoribosylamine--glycine ligase [Capnocytophaga sp. oral taxon 863 str. F0517]|uniref:phosphoribosylamine--glycine ligase n=1 Tax=Capnocytophaga sp. oral taxon 863 TaxID=1227265 RepID=UPI000397CE52|nr:phosphoribosylamine--glycine ligase [Capnocytophaga sp. oral taxon 863]ERI61381.1 phosphoribosylamine--glycine ligase [Capnocytophaga sp. oral taxon 863 str. F0517]
MNILLLGSGGREHAFAYQITQSPRCKQLYIAPGNAGTALVGENAPMAATDFPKIKEFCLSKQIALVVVGPEEPLVKGIVDFFAQDPALAAIPIVGPSQKGATLEGSKEFAKEFMQRHHIPTARYASFTKENLEQGLQFLQTMAPPYVLKADGLAAGKGVLILDNLEQAQAELKQMLLEEKFGAASQKVVIEEFLKGIELSCFVLTDGKSYRILPTAKDYKRIGEGDTGLNTGGMGAVSPVPFADEAFMKKIEDRIIIPTIEGIKKEQIHYRGFIFIGLIKVGNDPYVIEYNVRMGDPETEAVLPRIQTDLVDLLEAAAKGQLEGSSLSIDPRSATTVVLVSGGYPEDYQKGKVISGLQEQGESLVFHAGTSLKEGEVVTSGGRVLAITSLADNFKEALKKSYNRIEKISFEGMYYRKDIGKDLG